MKTEIKTLNYTESLLFCLATLFNRDITTLSVYTEQSSYSDDVYQQCLETLKSHQKLDRKLMQDNLQVFDESTWYFVYKRFTRLSELNFNKDIQIVWEALDYDYKNLPDQLWKYNSKDILQLYGITIKLPSFVVYIEKSRTKFIFFEKEMINICQNYLEDYFKPLDKEVVIEKHNHILWVSESIPNPQIFANYAIYEIDQILITNLSIILYGFLILAYFVNLITSLTVSCFIFFLFVLTYRWVTDSLLTKFTLSDCLLYLILIFGVGFCLFYLL
ncbi:hypothetical protein cce_5053 [Crocosphaera subtropica ATCC 51142]|uniref:Uncharacterized protein n=1 Tax=Crocosphaera subtropica (strain ATCC 51142 / BH68) TaxID=43989 RepID=B1X2N8_CROS5|nr:hypothetical protein [Crocosphaera subtropica]ACB54399.1 hypothetical protein cce_5053 [Crocosphaera subtropica ATCC 51142]